MITISGLRKSFGGRVLFRDADLRVGARDRLALVGPNGSGKTTLLQMILGLQSPDAGEISITKGARLGYLAQEAERLRGRTVLEEVVAAGPAMEEAGSRLGVLERELEEAEPGPGRDELLAAYAALQERFDALGGWSVEAEAQRILTGLGFSERDQARSTDELSGGWLMRVALAKLLLAAPDVLLLDEPTNHLDLESVIWLERFLSAYDGAVVLVSHDRDFMDAVATRVVEIDHAELVSYTGGFEDFVRQREERAEQRARAAKDQAKRVAEIERFVERFRYKASKARQVQSRIKMLDRMERVDAPRTSSRRMGTGFPPPPRSGRVVCALDAVTFRYGTDDPVYAGLGVDVERGEKVALVGPNGAGKTTLLKLLAGALDPESGERRLGHNVSCGYYAQHALEALDRRNRVIEEVQRAIPPGADVRARDVLGRFLFSGDDVDKPVSVLSGGERGRLALAKLLVQPHNFLCLDEPTNHLDMPSRDALEEALEEWAGTLVLITHDRHLIRSVANRVWEVPGGGEVRTHPGDYESYLWQKERQGNPEEEAAAAVEPVRGDPRARRRERAEARARVKSHRDAVAGLEAEIERLGSRVSEIEAALADPSTYADGDRAAALTREHGEARSRLSELESEWDRAAEALARAEAEQAEPA